MMQQFYNVESDGYLYERLDKVEQSIAKKMKTTSEITSYSIDDITKHCEDQDYEEIVIKYEQPKTTVYEENGKIIVKSETILIIVFPRDELVYGGADMDRELTVNEIIENNKERIDEAIRRLKATNKKAFYDRHAQIKKYMIAQAQYNSQNSKTDMRRLMKSKLMSYMKHPAIQM